MQKENFEKFCKKLKMNECCEKTSHDGANAAKNGFIGFLPKSQSNNKPLTRNAIDTFLAFI